MDEHRLRYLIERHLDSVLTRQERDELDAALAANPNLKRRLSDEAALHRLGRNAAAKQFSAEFNNSVMTEVENEAALSKLLSAAKPEGFKPFFQARVMRRIAEEEQESGALFSQEISGMMARLFPRVAVPAFAAASIVMAGNVGAAAAEAPLVDALFGLPTDTPSELTLLLWEEE